MRNILLVLAVLMVTPPVLAGSLKIEVTDGTDGTVTNTFTTFTDAHITRWIAANQTSCNIAQNTLCSRTQVLNYITSKFTTDQVELVRKYEEELAISSAADAVSPIVVQP